MLVFATDARRSHGEERFTFVFTKVTEKERVIERMREEGEKARERMRKKGRWGREMGW